MGFFVILLQGQKLGAQVWRRPMGARQAHNQDERDTEGKFSYAYNMKPYSRF